MPERFPTRTAHGCEWFLNAPRRERSDRADGPLIAIDPLLEARHKAYGFALNTPEPCVPTFLPTSSKRRDVANARNIASVTRKVLRCQRNSSTKSDAFSTERDSVSRSTLSVTTASRSAMAES